MSNVKHKHPNQRRYNWSVYSILDRLLSEHSKLLHGAVYDLGCGEMPYREWITTFADSYTGIDWSSTPHSLKADIVTDLNEPLPVKDCIADAIISISVLEHLRKPEVMLSEAYRILKPGGHLVLQVPFMWHIHEAPFDFFRYTRYGLDHLFTQAGFRSVMIQATTGFWTMWVLKLNYQSTKLIRGPRSLQRLIDSMLWPMWAMNQRAALLLDRFFRAEQETAGYFVVARKDVL